MHIQFRNNKPFFEGVSINKILQKHKTPFYIYSQKNIEQSYSDLKKNLNSEIFYSIKANSNQAILKIIKNCGAGADVVSIGELKRSINAGFNPNKIIFVAFNSKRRTKNQRNFFMTVGGMLIKTRL